MTISTIHGRVMDRPGDAQGWTALLSDSIAAATALGALLGDFPNQYRYFYMRWRVEGRTAGENLQVRVSLNGATFDSGGSDYSYAMVSQTATTGGTTVPGTATEVSSILPINNAPVATATGVPLRFEMWFDNATDRMPNFEFRGAGHTTTASQMMRVFGNGERKAVGQIKGVEFSQQTSALGQINYELYGLKAGDGIA